MCICASGLFRSQQAFSNQPAERKHRVHLTGHTMSVHIALYTVSVWKHII